LAEVAGALERVALEIGRSLTTISAGGGLPVPYKPGEVHADLSGYFTLWDATRRKLEQTFGHRIRLEIEPGRYLTAESGFLVTEVRAIKKQGGRKYTLVDAGFNTLARPVLYGAYHPMSLCPADDAAAQQLEDVAVGGPLCESGDIFTQTDGGFVATRALPRAQVGDYLVIEIAGAYGFVMASNYNSKPLPAEVLLDGGKARLVRKRQTPEDLVRGETV
jgi:diaminopimelate decarboxylase